MAGSSSGARRDDETRGRPVDPGDLQATPALHRLADDHPNESRRAAGRVLRRSRRAYLSPGKTHLVRSSDDGETWRAPEIIRDSPLDDRDAGIIETARGTLLVSWFSATSFESNPDYRDYGATLTAETREQYLGNWVLRSEDGGRTWGEPIRVNASAPHGPVQLRDGRILYLGVGRLDDERTIVAEESTDDVWPRLGSKPASVTMREPHGRPERACCSGCT